MSAEPKDLIEGTPLIRPSTTDHPLYDSVVEACRTVFDPEIPVNIFDLGLVYTIDISNEAGEVVIVMTLTAPAAPSRARCPAGWPTRSSRCRASSR
jgi:metal-sulfur cluster biosynthetic enzyme